MKTLAAIHGVPFRKIVSTNQLSFGSMQEFLACGHVHVAPTEPYYDHATKRRCHSCKWKKDNAKKGR